VIEWVVLGRVRLGSTRLIDDLQFFLAPTSDRSGERMRAGADRGRRALTAMHGTH